MITADEIISVHNKESKQQIADLIAWVMAYYLIQADDIVSFVAGLPTRVFGSTVSLDSYLSKLDNMMIGYNKPITEILKNSEIDIVNMNYSQLNDYLTSVGVEPLSFAKSDIYGTIKSLEKPLGKIPFELSDSIWDETKRSDILREITSGNLAGKNKFDIAKDLEKYLKETGGSGYKKALTVVETENNRSMSRGYIDTTRLYNDTYSDDRLLILRSLSSSHKVEDICDELVGAYDPDQPVPEYPSHPHCYCELDRIFESVYTGSIKNLKTIGGLVYSSKYQNQVASVY